MSFSFGFRDAAPSSGGAARGCPRRGAASGHCCLFGGPERLSAACVSMSLWPSVFVPVLLICFCHYISTCNSPSLWLYCFATSSSFLSLWLCVCACSLSFFLSLHISVLIFVLFPSPILPASLFLSVLSFLSLCLSSCLLSLSLLPKLFFCLLLFLPFLPFSVYLYVPVSIFFQVHVLALALVLRF